MLTQNVTLTPPAHPTPGGYINVARGVNCAGMCGSPGICGHLFTAGDPAAYYEWKPESEKSEKSELYSPPLQKRITLNTGQKMPLINCGGTAATVPGHHDSYSNYSSFLQQGGRGIDTALTYGAAMCCMRLCVQWQWQWQWQGENLYLISHSSPILLKGTQTRSTFRSRRRLRPTRRSHGRNCG